MADKGLEEIPEGKLPYFEEITGKDQQVPGSALEMSLAVECGG
jgi:hypothetical protein